MIVGVGTDLVEVERMRAALARTPRFAERVFTSGERAYAARVNDPAQRLAARFAAKEAFMKALGLGIGSIPLAAVEVVVAASGAPSLALHGRAAAVAAERGVTGVHVSLTHVASMAAATVVLEGGAG